MIDITGLKEMHDVIVGRVVEELQTEQISLRDRFAMIALDRCIKAAADPDVPFGRTRDVASKAYEITDAMLKAREGKE